MTDEQKKREAEAYWKGVSDGIEIGKKAVRGDFLGAVVDVLPTFLRYLKMRGDVI